MKHRVSIHLMLYEIVWQCETGIRSKNKLILDLRSS